MLKIEIEGVDGCGKTTALKYLIERAKKRKLKVVETREVGNPHIPICVKLREIVLDPKSGLSGEAMELVFSAMRIENDRWLKELQKTESPDLVVSDRGWFSHLAYTDFNVSTVFTQRLYVNLMGLITAMPNVVIYFRVNTDTALKRRVKRGTGMDVIELKGVGYQEDVRKSFENHLDQAKRFNPDMRIFEVDANQDVLGVQKQLDRILDQLYTTNVTNSPTP
jgi:dTMP kinase